MQKCSEFNLAVLLLLTSVYCHSLRGKASYAVHSVQDHCVSRRTCTKAHLHFDSVVWIYYN